MQLRLGPRRQRPREQQLDEGMQMQVPRRPSSSNSSQHSVPAAASAGCAAATDLPERVTQPTAAGPAELVLLGCTDSHLRRLQLGALPLARQLRVVRLEDAKHAVCRQGKHVGFVGTTHASTEQPGAGRLVAPTPRAGARTSGAKQSGL